MIQKYSSYLCDVPSNRTFRTSSGEIKNLRELRNNLLNKGKSFYNKYVNEKDNHFSNWIESVVKDHELSLSLQNTNSVGKSVKLIDDRIKYLELWLSFNGPKEKLNSYLVNGPISQKEMGAPDFKPTYQKFENLSDYSKEDVALSNSPSNTTSSISETKLTVINETKPVTEMVKPIVRTNKIDKLRPITHLISSIASKSPMVSKEPPVVEDNQNDQQKLKELQNLYIDKSTLVVPRPKLSMTQKFKFYTNKVLKK